MENFVVNNSTNTNKNNTNENIFENSLGGASNNIFALPAFDLQRFDVKYNDDSDIATITSVTDLAEVFSEDSNVEYITIASDITLTNTVTVAAEKNLTINFSGTTKINFGNYNINVSTETTLSIAKDGTSNTSIVVGDEGDGVKVKFDSSSITSVTGLDADEAVTIKAGTDTYTYSYEGTISELTYAKNTVETRYHITNSYSSDTANLLAITDTDVAWALEYIPEKYDANYINYSDISDLTVAKNYYVDDSTTLVFSKTGDVGTYNFSSTNAAGATVALSSDLAKYSSKVLFSTTGKVTFTVGISTKEGPFNINGKNYVTAKNSDTNSDAVELAFDGTTTKLNSGTLQLNATTSSSITLADTTVVNMLGGGSDNAVLVSDDGTIADVEDNETFTVAASGMTTAKTYKVIGDALFYTGDSATTDLTLTSTSMKYYGSVAESSVTVAELSDTSNWMNVTNITNTITIDFHIIVAYGVSISTVAENLMSTVRYKVEEFTGMQVEKINIFVEGVRVID